MQITAGNTLVILPTYNEKENIEDLVLGIRNLANDFQVLVVDDNSPDGTGQIAENLVREDDGIHVLHRSGKLGLGSAYKAGFAFGLERDYQYLCTMDADLSHNPRILPQLVARASTGSDVVIGSRYIPGGQVEGSALLRRLISRIANVLAHVLLGIQANDCTAGFRCYKRTVLETLDFDSIFSNGYSFLIETAFRCQEAGFQISEVPITFINRRKGHSKIQRREIYLAVYTIARLRTQALPWRKIHQLVHEYHTVGQSHSR